MLLHPVTVLVGANGAGKSAVFDALINYSQLSRGAIRYAFGQFPFSYQDTLHRAANKSAKIGFRATLAKDFESKEALRHGIEYNQPGLAGGKPHYQIHSETVHKLPGEIILHDRHATKSVRSDQTWFSALQSAKQSGLAVACDPLVDHCASQVHRLNKFRLEPGNLAAVSRLPEIAPNSIAPRLAFRGEDLAAVLYFLSETGSPQMDVVRERIQQLEPKFSSFDFNLVGADGVAFSVIFSDSRGTVPAIRLSSGLLSFIGLIVLVTSSNRPALMMIEEPENGLTPEAVRIVYQCTRELALSKEASSRSQILISSHSPFVICEAWNGEDRDFIYQIKCLDGRAMARKFSDVIKAQGVQLGKERGERKHLSLSTADDVMCGRLS